MICTTPLVALMSACVTRAILFRVTPVVPLKVLKRNNVVLLKQIDKICLDAVICLLTADSEFNDVIMGIHGSEMFFVV